MQLKRARDIEWEDLPKIEDPFFASSHIEDAFYEHGYTTIWGIDSVLDGPLSLDYEHGRDPRLLERLLELLEDGDIFLLHSLSDRPFSPVVKWKSGGEAGDKGHWVVSPSVTNMSVSWSLKWIIAGLPSRASGGGGVAGSSAWDNAQGRAREPAQSKAPAPPERPSIAAPSEDYAAVARVQPTFFEILYSPNSHEIILLDEPGMKQLERYEKRLDQAARQLEAARTRQGEDNSALLAAQQAVRKELRELSGIHKPEAKELAPLVKGEVRFQEMIRVSKAKYSLVPEKFLQAYRQKPLPLLHAAP